MLEYKRELLLTLTVAFITFVVILLMKRGVRKFSFVKAIDANRKKVIIYLNYLVIYIISASAFAIIWGVDIRQFTIFISSILAVLGIGFFAQWSILSNLTASVILFFNHPVRLGDRIRILDKDFDWTGEVIDITGFYLFMKTDDGRTITIPNSLIMQKGIEILDKKEPVDKKQPED